MSYWLCAFEPQETLPVPDDESSEIQYPQRKTGQFRFPYPYTGYLAEKNDFSNLTIPIRFFFETNEIREYHEEMN